MATNIQVRKDSPPLITRSRDLWRRRPVRAQFLARAQRAVLSCGGLRSHPPADGQWLLFPYYHWILDDERTAFARQIRYLRRFGDIISLDDAVTAMGNPSGLGGKYFCLTFDDGFRNWRTNAFPVLVEENAPAAFFISTKYIGLDLKGDWEQIAPFYQRSWGKYGGYFDFLTWDDCREMSLAGYTIGSHTHSHLKLKGLSATQARFELEEPKRIIESRLGIECRHFACPWGKTNDAFEPGTHPEMAKEIGYRSFLTTDEGPNLSHSSPFAIKRNDVAADWGALLFRKALFERP